MAGSFMMQGVSLKPLYLILVPISISAITFVLFRHYNQHNSDITPPTIQLKTSLQTPTSCRTTIEARRFPETATKEVKDNELTRHEARAIPNAPLKRTFGIQNAFTTSDKAEAKKFVARAHRLLGGSGSTGVDWVGIEKELRDMLENIIEGSKSKHESRINIGASGVPRAKVKLSPAVQALSLRTSLWVLFNMKSETHINNKLLAELGGSINSAWMGMKDNGEEKVKAVDFKDNKTLQDRLSAVFSRTNTDINIHEPTSNPLNLILPSFETLWRVVLRLFIVIHGHENMIEKENYKRAVIEFMRHPTHAQFRHRLDSGDDAPTSAEDAVLEALRLYPPTRRVRRAFKEPNSATTTIEAADVEAVHLNPQIWGPDAAEFRPCRWHNVSHIQQPSFLAFGSRPFLCPASQSFGPMVVGLLVGVLLKAFGSSEQWVLGSEDKKDMREIRSKERLSNERGAYEGLFLSLDQVDAGAIAADP
ncbi:hypothetical protein BDV06DRAFT_183594 [Aspergillus oleicola]